MIVYGIKNCDTVKKTLNLLKVNQIPYEFHDYKKVGIEAEKLKEWCSKVSYDELINRRGTTWRKLDDSVKESIKDQQQAIELMVSHNSIIKRPVIELSNGEIIVGFEGEFLSNELENLK
jgi:Spx/MgsR family transcriptional regulator